MPASSRGRSRSCAARARLRPGRATLSRTARRRRAGGDRAGRRSRSDRPVRRIPRWTYGPSTSGVPLGPTVPTTSLLGDRRALRDGDRAEVRERDGVAVRGLDRHRLAVRGHGSREADRARCRRDHRLACRVRADVDAAMLARGVRVRLVVGRTAAAPAPGRASSRRRRPASTPGRRREGPSAAVSLSGLSNRRPG